MGVGAEDLPPDIGRLEALVEGMDENELVAVLTRVIRSHPRLERFRDELLTVLQTALVRDDVAQAIAGEPRRVVTEDDVMTADELLAEARVAGEAHRTVLGEDMLDAAAVSKALGSRSTNLRQYANDRRRRGDLIGVPHRNQYLYPAFQIDRDAHRVDPVVQRVNRLLGADEDPWGVASWWLSPSGRLRGRPPRDCLDAPELRERLPEIAEALVEPLG